jgi:hypothetical protein
MFSITNHQTDGIEDHGHFGLQKHDRVTFEIKKTPRELQAVRVKHILASYTDANLLA